MAEELCNWVKQIFCGHEFVPEKWHWTHGPYGNEPARIQAKWVCKHCGKVQYRYPERGSFEEMLYTHCRQDLME